MWRYEQILKQMYSGTNSISASATPAPSSLKEIRERLSLLEQLLQDIISQQQRGERTLIDLITQLSRSLNNLRAQVSSLREEVQRLGKVLEGVGKVSDRLDEFERYLRELELLDVIESKLEELKSPSPDCNLLEMINKKLELIDSRIRSLSAGYQPVHEVVGFQPSQGVDAPSFTSLNLSFSGVKRKKNKKK